MAGASTAAGEQEGLLQRRRLIDHRRLADSNGSGSKLRSPAANFYRRWGRIFLAAAVVLGFGVSLLAASVKRRAPRSAGQPVMAAPGQSSADGEMDTQLYRNVVVGAGGNGFISTVSIRMALAMTMMGARGNSSAEIAFWLGGAGSKTHARSKALMDAVKRTGPGAKMQVANGIFVDEAFPVEKEYVTELKTFYGATSEQFDFKGKPEDGRRGVNEWAKSRTEGKIPELLPQGLVTSDTKAILVNAVYFKGKWAHQFDASRTREAQFHNEEGLPSTVKMMSHKTQYEIFYDRELKVRFVVLPYAGNEVSMVLAVPQDKDGLRHVEKSVTADMMLSISGRRTEAVLNLPRFKVEASFDLKQALIPMGIRDIFSQGKCDLSGISAKNDLFVSSMIHKAVVEVDEQGTEAAAATAATMMLRSLPPTITVDRPFMFAIREHATRTIWFMGRVTKL